MRANKYPAEAELVFTHIGIDIISAAIYQTWNAIGPDCYAMCSLGF